MSDLTEIKPCPVCKHQCIVDAESLRFCEVVCVNCDCFYALRCADDAKLSPVALHNSIPREERWREFQSPDVHEWSGETPTGFSWGAFDRGEEYAVPATVDVLFDDRSTMARATFIWEYYDGPIPCFVDDKRRAVNLNDDRKIVGWRPHVPPTPPEAT